MQRNGHTLPTSVIKVFRQARARRPLPFLSSFFAAALIVTPGHVFASDAANAAQREPTIASVTVAPVVRAEMIGRVPVSGTLVPKQEVLIYPQVNGSTIDTLKVDVGDLVASQEILATLNTRTLTAEQARAKAEYARAQASVSQAQCQITSAVATSTRTTAALDWAQRLRDAGTTTQAGLDQALADSQTADAAVASANDGLAVASAELQQAQAQLDIVNLNMERTTLRAPVAGLISARNGQIGAIASSGAEPIFRMIMDGTVEVEAEVIETALGKIAAGDTAELATSGVGDVVGTVRRISPAVDPVNRLGIIRIAIEDQARLRSGIFASGWDLTEKRVSPAVPTSAVLTDAGGTFVLVVNAGILEKRAVAAGLIWNDLREIVSGVSEGETVVAKAGSFFGDGDRINPIVPETSVAEGATE